METIGEYKYPDKGTFKEALEVAQEALITYGGVIPVKVAAEKVGYKIADPAKIGGGVYKKLDDLCSFGLLSKERGGYKATEIAVKALDPHDASKAAEGKADALRKMPILQKLYTELAGEIPLETAIAAKISQILDVPWTEAQRHAPMLLNLVKETFPYMKPSTTVSTVVKPPSSVFDRGDTVLVGTQTGSQIGDMVRPYGEVKTTSGTIVVRNKAMLKLARELLNTLEQDFEQYEKQTTKSVRQTNHTNEADKREKE